jgi:acyl transferase domain-containing protein/glutamate-1-semialdehyde aminotransferase/thioesterase domain-containing protein
MDHEGTQGVAVIGMAGRFPGAPTIDAFWRNLRGGVESITHFTPDEVALRSTLRPDEQRVYARGILEGAELFDATFFGYMPREAELMDPQHRVFLEVAWEALEHAGYDAGQAKIPVGVFCGLSMNTYLLHNLCSSRDVIEELLDNHQISTHPALLGNDKDFLPTRVSYKLGLTGPSVAVQTACSTSLVALTLAWQSLMSFECDLTLTGGISISFPQNRSYLYTEGAMVCSDGHCRAFDADAQGMLYGAGVGVVVLKRLEDALRDRDTIYAVILGAAINNDGAAKVSYMAPSIDGQATAIMTAQELAGVDAKTITYVETHGTGTPLGDPIEIAALTQAFQASTQEKQFCAIGSVKTNIGHLEAAAGISGLIKTVLALHHKEIPPSLNFRSPNPKIDFLSSPFFVNTILRPWDAKNGLRRAGVSSFGVGGTNAHVVLEEAPTPTPGGPSRLRQLLVLSAKSPSALRTMTANLAAHLEGDQESNLADVAFTLQRGRKAFAHRLATVVSNTAEAVARLRSIEASSVYTGKAMAGEPSIVFLFPGQGTQYLDMGRQIYQGEPVFRGEVDRCAEILRRYLDLDLREVLYPAPRERAATEQDINQTWLAQPAIFVVEYALARLWMSWGVKPAVLLGHSIGEYVAAVISEAFTLEDALALLAARARLMHALPGGAMLSVRLGADDIEAMLPQGVSLAAINSPVLCAVSGPTELLQEFQRELDAKDVATRFLHTSHAFHSAMMDPMLPEFAVIARRIPGGQPKLPWVSTSTGRWMSREDLVDGAYWVRQIRHPVRFAAALDPIIEHPQNILLEVGPGQTLSQLARQHAKKPAEMIVVATLGPVGEPDLDLHSMLTGLGRLWVSGVSVDWETFYSQEERRRLPLPTYPFERNRYWIEPAGAETPVARVSGEPASSRLSETNQVKEPEMDTSSILPAAPTLSRKDRLIQDLRDLFQSYSGADHSQTDENASFLDLGFDSLLLTQASQGVQKRFGVKVTFRRMIGDLSTLRSLSAFLDDKLPPEALPSATRAPASEPAPVAVGESARAGATVGVPTTVPDLQQLPSTPGGSLVETVIQQQMVIMAQQLELLRQTGLPGGRQPALAASEVHPGRPSDQPVVTAVKMEKESHFGPFKAIEKGVSGGLTSRQQTALETLVSRYNRRTAKSKAFAQEHRASFCDPRAAGNFRQLWKEMVYPIVCARSKGSRIWDIDENEYIDVTMGFGANYLGHSPDFVMKALEEQMKKGVEIGPQSPLAGEVARMICEFTGMERATFCNTGSEAVMAALRVARTVTGREKVVYFCGDYHGIFDEVLGRPALFNGVPGAMPIAPGIPHLANVMVLEYGSSSALETIRRHADEIAGVLVEPVQSRHPDLQPREFLQELRRLTTEHEIALIFDEVITGFRVAPGGAQEYFGVKADLATYGKVIGGGMPIGVLAGSAAFMDALDGGFWQYGDDSSPPTGVTFFAGTFVRHPLAMAAAHAVLKHLKSAGPALQERTNKLTARFVTGLNEYFEERQLPMRLQTFSAVFYYDFHPDLKYAGLLFYYLRDRGIHIWEGRVGHISIAHTDHDLDRLGQAFQESVEEMQSGGFLPESDRAPARGAMSVGGESAKPSDRSSTDGVFPSDPARFPLAEAQREMWIGAQMRPEAAGPHHACTGLYLDGDLDVEMLRRAICTVVQRHEGLRCTFSEEGTEVIFRPSLTPEIPVHDLSSLAESEREVRVNEILHQEGRRLLDMTVGPLVEFQILKLSPQRHLLILTVQMIVCDGWSHYVVFEDLGELYTAYVAGLEPSLKPAVPMREYALWEQTHSGTDEARESEAFWLSQFETAPTPVNLPTSRPRLPARTFEGDRREVTLPPELYQNIKGLARKQRNSYFAVLLAAFQVWLYRLSGARDLVVGVPFAAQSPLDMERLVGQCASILPLRVHINSDEAFSSVLKKVWSSVLDAQEHWDFSFGRLLPQLDLPRDPSRIPLVSVLFNIDPPMAKVKFHGLRHRFVTGPRYYFQYDLGFNLVEGENTIQVECDYNSNLFDGNVIQCWVASYQALLEAVVGDPDQSVSRLPMMSERDRGRLLAGEARAISAEGTDAPIHALIEAQALVSPDRVAATDQARVVLTDENFEPVPVGVPGEILVSSPGLAGGYHNVPSLTAENFVNISIGDQEPCRFYRSGQMGQWSASGELEILGARDQWVTVRGCRFGLGAIEVLLREHPGVKDVVVVLREDLGDGPGLAAYVVTGNWERIALSSAHTELVRELRRLVRRTLPETMHPARFVVVETLPREADGRVDRMALPTPPEEEFEYEDYVAPRNKTEEILARIWRELLNLDKVSVKDSFFDLSGQSLLAVRLFNRIEQACNRRLPIAILFRAPTIEQLAIELTSCDGTSLSWPSLVPIQPQGTKPPLFLVHGAGGNILLYGALAKRLEPDYPLYGLQSQGLDGQSKPLRTIEEMAIHYLQEIRTVQPNGPYLLGGYCLGGTVAYEMAQRLIAQGEPVAIVAMLDTYNFARALRSSFISFLWQKLRFHWSNFIRLRPVAMWRYLREKKRLAADGGWAGIATEMPGSTLQEGVARAESGIEASVQAVNDHAGDIYQPRSYPGVLTLFKPHINYKFYPDPEMGWGDLALGGLDIVEMPMNPHAMLIEPYVELLAKELKARLDRASGSGEVREP